MQNNEFNIIIDLGDTKLKARKWKGKDKKNFIKEMSKKHPNANELLNILVYNCLENQKIVLTELESKYVLTKIREKSLGADLKFNFICNHCDEEFEQKWNLSNIIVPLNITNKPKLIKTNKNTIRLGRIKNKDFYFNAINENPEEKDIIELLLSIENMNGQLDFTLENLMEIFDEMDLDEFEEIIKQWNEIKFSINEIHDVECPKCSGKTKYKFDELNEFFPTSWFEGL